MALFAIDGYTQPGASANTLANGDKAVLRIQLDGSGTSRLVNGGLVVSAGGSTIRGLNIGLMEYDITLQTLGGNIVEGDYIGTDISGTLDRGNPRLLRRENSSPATTAAALKSPMRRPQQRVTSSKATSSSQLVAACFSRHAVPAQGNKCRH